MIGAAIDRITANFISIRVGVAMRADPLLILEGTAFSLFRSNGTQGLAYYIAGRPKDLSEEDIAAINQHCDKGEGRRNRAVKKELAAALKAHFNGKAFHIYDVGSGKKSIADYLDPSVNATLHAIDTDPACVAELHKMNIPASTWESVPSAPQDIPSVCVSVYALHFMVNNGLAENIRTLAGNHRGGFFTGNFYIDPAEKETGEGRQKLRDILNRHGMSHVVMPDPDSGSSEYWIISPDNRTGEIEDFAVALHDSIIRRRNKRAGIEVHAAAPT